MLNKTDIAFMDLKSMFRKRVPTTSGGTFGTSAYIDISEEKGSATITAGNQSVTVNHSLGSIPKVFCQAKTNVFVYPSNETASDFKINLEAPQGTDTVINYFAKK